ncbi:MAG: four helix bundle protein [Acidobacteriota bacterium]
MQIFKESKTFPKEERYSLTDQIRRSSQKRGWEHSGRISKKAISEYVCQQAR